ncbi:GDSL-type esterase/lipase family protein [Halarcobacter anaerophilus]|jgi:lysophospholipase L1-like esterase|uniref:GDSL-type esterase/lipase family protein n=1 Tax=Halarcobacter anaerophilus TaxID=877500 RepID=UPI0005C8E434|nr:GDSL-type esterase/lipase family protein [Halarcobacter anaerophilus]
MKKNIDIVFLGDSLINRGDWKTLLKEEHIVNLGVEADLTSSVLKRVDTVLEIEPKVVVLMIGVNDLCISTPMEDVYENYKKILKKLENSHIKIVVNAIFITQMPSVNKKVLTFNKLLKEYCKKQNILFLDINEAFENEKKLLKEELTTDGLHLGQKAYKVWAYKLNKFLKEII